MRGDYMGTLYWYLTQQDNDIFCDAMMRLSEIVFALLVPRTEKPGVRGIFLSDILAIVWL